MSVLSEGNFYPSPHCLSRFYPAGHRDTEGSEGVSGSKQFESVETFSCIFLYNAKWLPQYSSRIQPLLEALKQVAFPLISSVVFRINDVTSKIAEACLKCPRVDDSYLLLETDVSGFAIGSFLSQNCRPIAYFFQILLQRERNHSVAEKEALAIIESFDKFSNLLSTIPLLCKAIKSSSHFFLQEK